MNSIDKLQQAKPQVTKRVSEAPKTLKSGSGVKTTDHDRMKRDKQQLRATGKVRDPKTGRYITNKPAQTVAQTPKPAQPAATKPARLSVR